MTGTQRRTAIRMIGYLLEYHPTHCAEARNVSRAGVKFDSPQATCWCLTGAANVVSKALKLGDVAIFGTLVRLFDTDMWKLADMWDSAAINFRTGSIVQALKEYK